MLFSQKIKRSVLTPLSSSSDGEMIRRFEKRIELNDSYAIFSMGSYYALGLYGFHQKYTKAFELWHRAAELGNSSAYYNFALCYDHGSGVDMDKKKAIHYHELAAMGGDETARHNLGFLEHNSGNTDRALKHHMIAIRGGYAFSLKRIKQLYSNGRATKEDYTKALQSYQVYLGEIKSKQRDEAAAFSDQYRYY